MIMNRSAAVSCYGNVRNLGTRHLALATLASDTGLWPHSCYSTRHIEDGSHKP